MGKFFNPMTQHEFSVIITALKKYRAQQDYMKRDDFEVYKAITDTIDEMVVEAEEMIT